MRWRNKQCNKLGAIRENKARLAQSYKLKTNYVKNTCSISFYDLEQVTPIKYQSQKYVSEK